jgi:hypothetical protein
MMLYKRHEYIPTKHNLKATPQRKPIDRRNDRLLPCPPTNTSKPTQWMSHLRRTQLHALTPNLPQLDQVLSCAERLLTCASNDSDSEIGLPVKPIEYFAHLHVPREGDRVHGALAIDGYEEDIWGGVGEEDV